MATRIRLGFLGAGAWGRQKHLPAIDYIREQYADELDIQIAALCEQDAVIAEGVCRQYAIEKHYVDLNMFADDPDLDAFVVVVNPRGLTTVIERLVPRRLPIFSEKPPGWSQAEAQHLAEIVPSPNLVAYNRRFFPITERARAAIAKLQAPYYVSCNIRRHARPDSQEYAQGLPAAVPFVMGTAIHELNLLEYLFGPIADCEPTPIASFAPVDHWHADLAFAGGMMGRMNILPCCGSATEWIEVHSPERSLYIRLGVYSPIDLPGSIEVHEGGQLVEVICGDETLPQLVQEGFCGEYLEFFRAIRDGGSTRSTFKSAVNTMRICEIIEPLTPQEVSS